MFQLGLFSSLGQWTGNNFSFEDGLSTINCIVLDTAVYKETTSAFNQVNAENHHNSLRF